MNKGLGLCVGWCESIEVIIIVACLLSNQVVRCWHVQWFLLWVLLVVHWSLVIESVILSRSSDVKIWSGLVIVWLLEHWLALLKHLTLVYAASTPLLCLKGLLRWIKGLKITTTELEFRYLIEF